MRKLAMTFLSIFALLLTAPMVQASEGSFLDNSGQRFEDECGQFWPHSGYFWTDLPGDQVAAGLDFKMSQEAINALWCVNHVATGQYAAPYIRLEIYISDLYGSGASYELVGDFNENQIVATNWPNGQGTHISLIGLNASMLEPDAQYSVGVMFDSQAVSWANRPNQPEVSYRWSVGHENKWCSNGDYWIMVEHTQFHQSCVSEIVSADLTRGYGLEPRFLGRENRYELWFNQNEWDWSK